jgi:predicted aminopeptidase
VVWGSNDISRQKPVDTYLVRSQPSSLQSRLPQNGGDEMAQLTITFFKSQKTSFRIRTQNNHGSGYQHNVRTSGTKLMPTMIASRIPQKTFCKTWQMIVGFFFLLLVLQLEGCYYVQAARGQIDIMQRRRPVDEVIQDADSSDALREQLALVQEARRFSIYELHLPDNESYRSYADLERDFVVWNVFAAPEFSLQPKQGCYPVVGCVSYRGYFSREKADREADKLRKDGFDVVVGGVTAYSTLGRFSDPVLNTMMRTTDVDLVAVLFHELAHQRLYIKDDSEFNESFAAAVEEIGIERWLASRGQIDRLQEYASSREFRRRLMQYVQSARADLERLYGSQADEAEMRERKQAILNSLREEASREVDRDGRSSPGWLRSRLNNASLIPLSLYQGRLAEFRELLVQCNEDLRCFYRRAEVLAED